MLAGRIRKHPRERVLAQEPSRRLVVVSRRQVGVPQCRVVLLPREAVLARSKSAAASDCSEDIVLVGADDVARAVGQGFGAAKAVVQVVVLVTGGVPVSPYFLLSMLASACADRILTRGLGWAKNGWI